MKYSANSVAILLFAILFVIVSLNAVHSLTTDGHRSVRPVINDTQLTKVVTGYKPQTNKNAKENEKKNVGQPESKSPQEALKTFQLHQELVIELVAAEPLIADPVAFDWAVDGSLWVVEMGDYPLGADSEGTFGGKVRHLTDTNGDGVYDRSTTFLEKLPFPTGIKVWRDGVIVSTAPDVFFAKDSNGDGTADHREVLFTGFKEGNQQHRVNGLRWGLDGWLHLANGDSGGVIQSIKTGEKLDIRSSDLKINPDTGNMQLTFGRTQFGRNRDDFGNWVGGNNSNPMWQYVLDQTRLTLSPHVKLPDVKHHASDQPGASPVFPISKTLERFNEFHSANRFTSACSHMFFRDVSLGEDRDGNAYYGNAIVCEPVHNLVHREVVSRDGIYLNSRRAECESKSEFLASDDSWFRPVMVRTGPDGSLWIADMYRLVIEHPEWIPDEWQQKLDLQSGNDLGRIYRVYRKESRPVIPNLENASVDQLIDSLKSSNGTLRDMAHQRLLERDEMVSVASLLEAAATDNELPQSRLQILNAAKTILSRRGAVLSKEDLQDEEHILKFALSDEDPYIVAFGVSYCDDLLRDRQLGDERETTDAGRWQSDGAIAKQLRSLFQESAQRVQLELACSYRNLHKVLNDDQLLFDLIVRNQNDSLLLSTLLSNLNGTNAEKLAKMPWHELSDSVMRKFLDVLIKSDESNKIEFTLLESALEEPGPFDSETARLKCLSAIQEAAGQHLVARLAPPQKESLARWHARARTIVDESARDASELDDTVSTAIGFVGVPADQSDADRELLFRLLDPRMSPDFQSAAVTQLIRNGSKEISKQLISHWAKATPKTRARILSGLISRGSSAPQLLTALETHAIPISALDATQLDQFQRNLNDKDRQRLSSITPLPSSVDRQQVIQQYLSKINAKKSASDSAGGLAIFKKSCAACHKIGEEGNAIGPDLSALTDKSAATLLVAILDPNRAVEQKYTKYVVGTYNGLQYSGVLVQETASSIRLLNADQKEIELSRSDIEHLYAQKQSYMPEGFERDITPDQMNELIRYLQTGQASKE